MRVGGSILLLATLVLLHAPARAETFPRPASLEPQIRFWRDVFTAYSRYQVVLHDTVDLDKIYGVLDFRDSAEELGPIALDRLVHDETDAELDRLRRIFRRLDAAGPDPRDLSADEERIYRMWANDPGPHKFRDAADQLRSQRGLREKFAEGIRTAHRYLPDMERIVRDEGVPLELTRLPLVESCFNVDAYSKVGAAGIWQFMPSTGRLYAMEVNALVDERRDPIRSTRAAARFLRHNYEELGEWPLAITAYNHGPGGVARAVNETGTTDIGVIVQRYHGPAFGFASRNFYAEFVAALDVDKYHQAYFGTLDLPEPDPTRLVPLDRPVGVEVAARMAGIDRERLCALNPALMDPVVEGRRLIPAGYTLRLPTGGTAGFSERLAEFAAEQRVVRVSAPAVPTRRTAARASSAHRVARGDTLSEIAQRYRVSVASLKTANGLRARHALRPGQVLKIPRRT